MLRASLARAVLAAALACVAVGPAAAQTIVTPNTPETSGLNTPLRSAARTYQSYYNQSNFAGVTTPVLITGVQYRLSTDVVASTYPSQNLTFSDYTIQLSRASAAINTDGEIHAITTTFVQNQGANVTTVRSGPLTVPAGSFTQLGTGAANPFGPVFAFSTPYLYTPGQELLYTVGLSGYTPNTEPQQLFAAAGYANGVADAVSSTAGNSFSQTPNSYSDPLIVQFTFAPVPEPAGVLAAGGAALAAAGWVGRRVRRPAV